MPKLREVEENNESPRVKHHMDIVVPDHTGTILIAFHHERGESRVESYPVIAWEVGGDTRPITIEELDAPVYCLKLATGLWVFTGDTSFSDEAKALDYGKSRAKLRRETE